MRTEANDVSMAYDENGSGTPLVFVHGYPLSRKIWDPQLKGLANVTHMLAPDLRGHGDSPAPEGANWMHDMASDIAGLMEQVSFPIPAVICGLSMGGYVTFGFYRQFAPRLSGIILAATRAGADSEEGKQARDKAAAMAREKGAAAVVEDMLPKMLSPKTYRDKPELVAQVQAIMNSVPAETMVADLMGMRERVDATVTLEEIDLPVLILHGADDRLIPVKEAEKMHNLIRRSKLEIIPEAGHLLNMEQPERFNAAVEQFLRENFTGRG